MEKDKSKSYCPKCDKELKFNLETNLFEYRCDCYNSNKFKYTLLWCNECKNFTTRRGVSKESKCCTCVVKLQHKTMRENDPEGYAKRQSNATHFANEKMKKEGKGVWNPETHKLMEQTKLKNGTSLSNQEFREKIGCNGNPQEVIDRLKDEKLGIFSDKCLELKTERFNNYWKYDKEFQDMCLKNLELGRIPNFTLENGKRYYKGIEINDLLEKLDKKEICIPCGFNKRFGEWYYTNENILTGDIIKLNNCNFVEKDDILYYYDKSISDYIPWEDYKLKFSRKRLTKDITIFIEKLKSLDAFKFLKDEDLFIQSTFRSQDSTDWSGARNAFEQALVEKEVMYFSYIKFYIDNKNTVKPLVVGKSGSTLVNSAGSDVSFSECEDHGPARKLLVDENACWDKTQILIIKAKSEKQALYYEWLISNTFGLFES